MKRTFKLGLLALMGFLAVACNSNQKLKDQEELEKKWAEQKSPAYDSLANVIIWNYQQMVKNGDKSVEPKLEAFQKKVNQLVEKDMKRINNIDSLILVNPANASALNISLAQGLYNIGIQHAYWPKTPMILMRSANLQAGIGMTQDAYKTMQLIVTKYPDYKHCDAVFYFLAEMENNQLGKKEDAKKHYEEVVKRFPKSQFAEAAKKMLEFDLDDSKVINSIINKKQP